MRTRLRPLLLLALLFAATGALAQTPRVLLVGDSWAFFMWQHRSLRDTFALHGHPELVEKGDVTTISGSTAAEWAQPDFLALVTSELTANPTIDIVQLTIGGNDLLAGQPGSGWWVGMPAEEALFSAVAADVATVIDHVLALDPDLHLVLSTYDYPNFVESLDRFLGPIFCTPMWLDIGSPTPLEMNQAIVAFDAHLRALAASRSRVSIRSHWGLMQFLVGFPSHVPPIPPGDLPPPGDPALPSPIEAMAFEADCIHLSGDGYAGVADSLWWTSYEPLFDGIFLDGFESGDLTAWTATRSGTARASSRRFRSRG